jgi:hypothetical protein
MARKTLKATKPLSPTREENWAETMKMVDEARRNPEDAKAQTLKVLQDAIPGVIERLRAEVADPATKQSNRRKAQRILDEHDGKPRGRPPSDGPKTAGF